MSVFLYKPGWKSFECTCHTRGVPHIIYEGNDVFRVYLPMQDRRVIGSFARCAKAAREWFYDWYSG